MGLIITSQINLTLKYVCLFYYMIILRVQLQILSIKCILHKKTNIKISSKNIYKP